MKLHLPKLLLIAVLAAVNTVGFQAYAEWAVDGTGGLDKMYGYDKDTPAQDVLGDVIVAPTDTSFDTDATEASLKNVFLCNGRDGEGTERTITQIILQDGVNFTVAKNPWLNESSSGWFKSLLIKELEFGNEGTGKGSFALQQAKSVVTLETVSGTLSGVTNAGTLTIGKAEGTTALAGSMTNSGTLNLNGVLKIADLSRLKNSVDGNTLSNTTHGFREGNVTYSIASGGTINTSEGFSVILGDTADITKNLNITSSSISYTVNNSRGSVYEITSSYTTAVEYNGTSGDTAGATGFLMGDGTTLKLTGATTDLPHKVTIAAGNGGKATVMFANGKSQTYGELGLNSLINVESGSYVLGISGAGTVVTTTHQNNATGFHGGEIFITDGGKLLLDGYDSLGWVGTATPKISILNGTLALSGRQTFSTDLDMQGGAIVEANSTTIAGNPPKIDVWTNMDWTVGGTGNVVKNGVAVNMRQDVNIAIASGGELSIQGAFEGGSKLTKSGDGKLILDGVAKTLNGQLQMQAGTLQLGGTTAADDLVTLAGGLNQTGGTVDVVGDATLRGLEQTGGSLSVSGKAKIENLQKDGGLIVSNLGGAITVASTGELTLNSTYVLTGRLDVAEGGKVIGGNDLKRGANSGRPAEGNGWDSTILTILQAAEGATVTGLNKAWYNNTAFDVETSIGEDGLTNYLINARFNYYVQDADTKAEYSTATGLTGANTIYMNDGTTLVVKNDLVFSKLSISDNAKVNFEVDGVLLEIPTNDNTGNPVITSIDSLSLTNGAVFKIAHAFMSVGTEEERVTINMSGNSLISLNNGNSWGPRNLWADILVNGSARIGGSSNGNNSTVQGTISGNGTLTLVKENGINTFTIASTISDGSGEGNQLAIVVDSTNENIILSGNNTYTGGTTVQNGKLTAAHAAALGTGNIEVKSGAKLAFNTTGTISNTISGAGTVIKEGSGLLTLTGDNTFTGGTTITDGQVVLGNDNALGTGMIKLQGGSIEITENRSLSMNVDMANKNDFTGKINITSKKELILDTGAKIWIGSNAAINLADDAKFTYGTLSIAGTGDDSYITRSENGDNQFSAGSASHIVNNAEVTVTSDSATELKLKLTNSSLTNAGAGALTVTNAGNTLTEVHATGGNISLQNVGAALSLDVLEMATGKAVNVGFAENVTDQGVTVSSTASLLSGSSLNTSLTLSEDATLDMDGTVTIDGALNITGALTMGDKLSAMLAEMSSWETPELVLFTGVSSFNGDAVATEAELASNYFTGASSDLYVEYRVDNNVGSIVIINRMDAVPEPTTATLSLLALMGLCARRRRK